MQYFIIFRPSPTEWTQTHIFQEKSPKAVDAKSVLARLQSEEQEATLAGLATGTFDTDVQKLRTVSLPDLNDANDSEAKKTSLSDNEDVELETEVAVEEGEEGDVINGGVEEEDLEKTPQKLSSRSSQYYTPMSENPVGVPQIVIKPNTPREGNISLNSDQAEVIFMSLCVLVLNANMRGRGRWGVIFVIQIHMY